MPLITLIIPTYNRAKLLGEAMESVRSQEFVDYELIVVDDGSTDDTPAVLARFAEGEPGERFRSFHQPNAGQGAARNRGIAEARGEYCSFLDSDDLFFPWTLATVAEAIERHNRPSVIFGHEAVFACAEEFKVVAREPARLVAWPDLFRYAHQNRLGPCGSLVARTELLREAGGFLTERIICEDADLMLRLGAAPNFVQIESPALYGYRNHAGNFTGNGDAWLRGAQHFISRYRRGRMPVGPQRAKEFRRESAKIVKYLSTGVLYQESAREALRIYFTTWVWQLRSGNYRYLIMQPIRMLAWIARRRRPKRACPR